VPTIYRGLATQNFRLFASVGLPMAVGATKLAAIVTIVVQDSTNHPQVSSSVAYRVTPVSRARKASPRHAHEAHTTSFRGPPRLLLVSSAPLVASGIPQTSPAAHAQARVPMASCAPLAVVIPRDAPPAVIVMVLPPFRARMVRSA
jgi:hypothetical protein